MKGNGRFFPHNVLYPQFFLNINRGHHSVYKDLKTQNSSSVINKEDCQLPDFISCIDNLIIWQYFFKLLQVRLSWVSARRYIYVFRVCYLVDLKNLCRENMSNYFKQFFLDFLTDETKFQFHYFLYWLELKQHFPFSWKCSH